MIETIWYNLYGYNLKFIFIRNNLRVMKFNKLKTKIQK